MSFAPRVNWLRRDPHPTSPLQGEGRGKLRPGTTRGKSVPRRSPAPQLHGIPPGILQRPRDLRHLLTPPEQRLWRHLRDHQLGPHLRRQHVLLGRFIADFYCATAKLCIEVDGDSHAEPDQAEYDLGRTACLNAHGYRGIRFTNRDVTQNLEGVLAAIVEACGLSPYPS